ncbi:MAG: GNAT family N-acetyltransferase [Ktedonobacterales bacterium]
MLTIRTATAADAAAIAAVHVASWRTTYRGIVPDAHLDGLAVADREAAWARTLGNPAAPSFAFVARDDVGRVAGFASGGPRRDGPAEYAGELYAIYLLREAQGQGAGRRLVAAVARELAARGTESLLRWVFAQNPARRFYEALGGQLLAQQQFELSGAQFTEVAYGWPDARVLFETGGTDGRLSARAPNGAR